MGRGGVGWGRGETLVLAPKSFGGWNFPDEKHFLIVLETMLDEPDT